MVEFDPFSESYFEDPFPIYKQLRDEAPAFYHEELDCYFLSRFGDIWEAVNSGHFSHRKGTNSQDLLVGKPPNLALSSMVPPAHTALRKTLFPFFTPGRARALEGFVREHARRFVDEGVEHGRIDANGELGRRISVRVAFEIIGLPQTDADRVAGLVGLAFDRTPGVKGPNQRALDAQAELHDYLQGQIRERQKRLGGGDLLDCLITHEFEGTRLPFEQLLSNVYLLVVGGTETLPKVFAGGVHQLWRHPDQRAELASDPALSADAFWEILRYEMPTLMLGACAEQDTEICGGTRIRRGQKIMHLWVSANRDEREFEDPDTFDIHRRAPRILTFNNGRHRCLGAHVAQMEGRVLLEELLRRAPHYEVDMAGAVRIRSEFFRGFERLPIVFDAV
ncbi:MAG: cytochrome P450 [Myxococcota bacterium]